MEYSDIFILLNHLNKASGYAYNCLYYSICHYIQPYLDKKLFSGYRTPKRINEYLIYTCLYVGSRALTISDISFLVGLSEKTVRRVVSSLFSRHEICRHMCGRKYYYSVWRS